jgi:hypothetical protein
VSGLEEMSEVPTSRSIRTTVTNVGSPVGREPYGDRVPVVVAGVTTCREDGKAVRMGEGAQAIGHNEIR